MWLSQDDLIFNRLKSFHRQRVDSLVAGSPSLHKPENGFIVLHLIPEECLIGRSRFSGLELRTHGGNMPALGRQIGTAHFNVDGLIERNGSESTRAYSQLFRDGRLEAAMSDLNYTQNGASIIRVTQCEQAIFWLAKAYLRFCKSISLNPPIWVFASLANCEGARVPINRRWLDVSERTIDRRLAHLPEMQITSLEIKAEHFLRPLCDSIWQAAGVEQSMNYDKDGNWHEPS